MSPPNDTDTAAAPTTATIPSTATTNATTGTSDDPVATTTDPSCLTTIRNQMQPYGERLMIPEWDHQHHDNNNHNYNNNSCYRTQHGWCGQDLLHSPHTSNVHLLDSYYVQQRHSTVNDVDVPDRHNVDDTVEHRIGTTVTGYVHFTARAESHRGYCHGGAACSVMDDVIGWTAFCAPLSTTTTTTTNTTNTCTPWSGYTVQINTTLRRPIPIDSYLYVQGVITNIVRRKVYVTATLYQPNDDDNNNNNDHLLDNYGDTPKADQRIVYATADGIVVMNPNVLLQRPRPHETNPETETRTNKMNMDDNEKS